MNIALNFIDPFVWWGISNTLKIRFSMSKPSYVKSNCTINKCMRILFQRTLLLVYVNLRQSGKNQTEQTLTQKLEDD